MKKLFEQVLLAFLLFYLGGCTTAAQLRNAAYRGDVSTVQGLIDKGADVNAVTNGSTALTRAAMRGHDNVVRLLIDRGADIDMAFVGCKRYKEPYQTRCKKILAGYKTEVNQLQPTKSATINPSRESIKTVKSDVDVLPAVNTHNTNLNKKSYAVVIGVEHYRQMLPSAEFATSDAKLVSEYLIKIMGYPEENVITLLNDRALKSDLEKYIDRWLLNNVEEGSSVFIYYSGHGAPNPKTGNAYLVPYDGDPMFIDETGYPIVRLYESLSKLKAKEITVVLDSCFSGSGGRSVLAKGAKPLVMAISMPIIQKNISVLTASSGDQISSTYEEKGHGLLTYFMLKGIKDEDVIRPDGSIKLEDLFGYIKPQVERIARKQYNNEQIPQLIGPNKL